MSTVGMPYAPDNMKTVNIKKNLDEGSYLQRVGFETTDWLWNEVHPGPFEASRMLGRFVLPII
jgi:hypothetical protein